MSLMDFFAPGVSLTATVAGQTYNLNDGRVIRLEVYDLGLAPARRLWQRYPGQPGRTGLGGVIEPRYLDLAWRLTGHSLQHYYQLRELMQTVFRMRETEPVQLVFGFPNGARRAADVYLDGELLFSDRRHIQTRASGTFVADDPRLYDPEQREIVFAIGAINEGWAIPWEIPWSIGLAVINDEVTFTYAGASRLASVEYPLIRIIGPITNPIITNVTTGERIALTDNGGLVLQEGERVDIDLAGAPRRDARTIRNQAGESLAQYLSVDSDLSTWHFAYAGELLRDGNYATGANTLLAQGTGANSNTRIRFIYFDRYEAV